MVFLKSHLESVNCSFSSCGLFFNKQDLFEVHMREKINNMYIHSPYYCYICKSVICDFGETIEDYYCTDMVLYLM